MRRRRVPAAQAKGRPRSSLAQAVQATDKRTEPPADSSCRTTVKNTAQAKGRPRSSPAQVVQATD